LAGFEAVGEAACQWGTFGSARIAAVGAYGDAGHRLAPFEVSTLKVTPKLGVRALRVRRRRSQEHDVSQPHAA
jgi:hypothetical protein